MGEERMHVQEWKEGREKTFGYEKGQRYCVVAGNRYQCLASFHNYERC